VRAAIDRELDALGECIGYASAACGADILFLEAMLERKAEVNVILPFAIEDFIQTSVQFAGEAWVRRFRRMLELAGDRVYSATTEPFLSSEELFQFGNRIVIGLSQLRARSLATRSQLLAVVDPMAEPGTNGTAAVIESWVAEPRPKVIDLSEIRRSAAANPSIGNAADFQPVEPAQGGMEPNGPSARLHAEAASVHGLSRSIKTFLFADVKGFSSLTELQVPLFMYEFLRTLANRLSTLPVQPQLVQTWGDGLYVVMSDAFSMVEYALALQQAVLDTDWSTKGLPASLTMRIGLHAGPAFEGIDPFMKGRSFFGSHVTRAARIEPITLPGHIYATMQFVALLAAEQVVRPEPAGGWAMSCEYLGKLALAKESGDMLLYHVRPRFGNALHRKARR
jgi:class 3 adenylate cyclase